MCHTRALWNYLIVPNRSNGPPSIKPPYPFYFPLPHSSDLSSISLSLSLSSHSISLLSYIHISSVHWVSTQQMYLLSHTRGTYLLKNCATTSSPNVNETPLSFSPHPTMSLSGSAHSKSQRRPVSGISTRKKNRWKREQLEENRLKRERRKEERN